MLRRTLVAALACAGLVALAAPPAHAGALPPGSTDIPTQTVPDITGEMLVAHTAGTYTGAFGLDSGTYDAWVYRNAAGTLDFAYQFHVTTGDIERTSHYNFAGVTIYDAGYIAGTGSNAPNTMSRTLNGSVAGFGFLGANEVMPGGTSTIDVYRTNAVNFTSGTFTFQDGDTATVAAYAPVPPVPEPATVASVLASAPLLGLAAYRRYRRRARA